VVAAIAAGGGIAEAVPVSTSTTATSPHRGGTLTVLEGANYAGDWPEGLDPATNFDAAANSTMMDAIYGELFQIGNNDRLIYDLATGYQLTDGAKTLTVDLRRGVRFTDGTPFDAAAVVSNWKADLAGQSPVKPPWPTVTSITAAGQHTVRVQFTTPDGAVINQFQDALVNWIASPTALAKLGAKRFDFYPVGAGPFVVESDTAGSKLVLQRNTHYWQAGHPYLNGIVFESAASDEAALEDLQSGDGQAYEFMGTPQLVASFKKAGFIVTAGPGTGAGDVKLNTAVPPFDNKLAREAIYYATDANVIDEKVYDGTCPVTESFTGPGGLFYEPKVPSYRAYDLAKAKAIVQQLGGLSFTLYYAAGGSVGTVTAATLQTMYEAAGMKVSLQSSTGLPAYVQEFESGKWQLNPASIGSWDPAGGIGVAFDLQSHAPFSGVHDPQVDALIAKAAATPSMPARAKYYAQLAEYLNQQALTPFVCSASSWDIAKKGVQGPGLTSVTPAFSSGLTVLWQDVSMNNS
jgi:peptide/nickel transport system substrate-binding protein